MQVLNLWLCLPCQSLHFWEFIPQGEVTAKAISYTTVGSELLPVMDRLTAEPFSGCAPFSGVFLLCWASLKVEQCVSGA